jgi:hypothetical protein
MCTKSLKYANTGLVNISTANTHLDGTGTLGTVLTAAGLGFQGTKINAITIKATGNTTQGMVRLFTNDGVNSYLWKEVIIPANTQSAVVEAFQITISEILDLKPSETLLASTQNAESFNIYADGVDWQNCDCVSECSCSDMTTVAHTGMVNIATANSHLDGTGAIGTIITASGVPSSFGTKIPIVDIKAIQTTTEGMIRLFINNGTTNFLIWEIPIPGCTQTGVEPAYRTQCLAFIDLKAGYSLGASTQNAESFNIITFATDLTNCSC